MAQFRGMEQKTVPTADTITEAMVQGLFDRAIELDGLEASLPLYRDWAEA